MNGWVGIGSGIATAIFLAVLAAYGLQLVSVVLACGIFVVAALLILLSGLVSQGLPVSTADRLSIAVLGAILVLPILFELLVAPHTGQRLWPVRGLLISLVACGAAIYLSNLTDLAYSLPRLGGTDGSLPPCRASTRQRLRTVTQVTFGQRILTYVVVRLGIAAAVGFLVVGTIAHIGDAAASLLAVAAGALAAYYLNRVIPMASLATDPPVWIGDVVVLAEEYGAGATGWSTYYVSQIVFEGVHLTELDDSGRPRSAGPVSGHDRLVELADVKRLLRRRNAYSGCESACSGANPFCPLARGERL